MKQLPKIVGILNCTPDSFSGDGILTMNNDQWSMISTIQTMIDHGADVIDVGAESTSPNSQEISAEEEIARLKAIFQIVSKRRFLSQFSIDTRNAKTAQKAIESGFFMVNDVSGGRHDENMFSTVAETGIKYVLMYCKNASGRADLEQNDPHVFKQILDFFDEQIEKALQAGIKKEQIILDPGMGAFISTNASDSVEVLQKISELKKRYEVPVYIGASRKGFLAKLTSKDFGAEKRLGSSLAVALFAAKQGADFIRVHDTLETRQLLETFFQLEDFSAKNIA